ncbi:MAG: histidine kinase [Butyrivibrio sp.]|nr:histidine kinase [Butyrivibrio sp.]
MNVKIYEEQKHKINEQDYNVKALQMRPHFIFNTLSNIYYLCELNPIKAQKVIDNFITYLRKNINAVSKKGLISFEEELSHTKAYISVAKARYEDLLVVNYDTPFLNFKLPPLTLEPLVENAVKHALDPDSDPLHIIIRTRLESNYNVIIVENTGVDFPVEAYNESCSSLLTENESHIGLSNIKSRLAVSCGGSLKLSKRPNGGTIATIRIHADQSR